MGNKEENRGENRGKRFSPDRLPLINLFQRPYRMGGLTLLVALMAFVLFGGIILAVSLQNGLNSLKERFGADLIVVPLGYDAGMEGILLKGEPSYFYLDNSYVEALAGIEGVEQVSPQFYLISTGSDCCEFEVQLIGFDPETDFSIRPWIAQTYADALEDGDLIVGSSIQTEVGDTLAFFEKEYRVAARLAETGTGLDVAAYGNMNTLRSLMDASINQGFHFLQDTDPERVVSSILIRIAEGYDAETVKHNIRVRLDGLQIVKTQSMVSQIAESLNIFSGLLYMFDGVFLILTLAVLTIVFSVSANERRKEFGILRVLGTTRRQVAGLILKESMWISVAGGILGIAAAALAVFPFSLTIGKNLGLPYLPPKMIQIFPILLLSLVAALLLGPLTAAGSAWKISHTDTCLLLREGE